MAPPPLKIAQPFMAGFTVRECSKSRQGRKILADGHHCARPSIFLSSLAGLLPLFDAIPSHEWLGYCHRIAPQLCRLRASVSWTAGASAARPRFRPHKNLSHQLYSPSARKRRPQRRQARPICRTPNQNIFQPRRGGIFRSLQTATMMSLLTELCPLLNGDATNMSALTGLGKSGLPPCSIRASCVARKSKLNSSRSSTANCLWILADSHGRRRSNWVETTVPRGQGAGRVRPPTGFLALTDQSPWGV